jgi:hypothetical protein
MAKGIWVGNYFDYVYLVEGVKIRRREEGFSIIGVLPSGTEVFLEVTDKEDEAIAIMERLCERLTAIHPADPRA